MGAWNELDTEISVILNTSDLDDLINLDDELGIFEEVKKEAENIKKKFETGSKRGVQDLSVRNRSFQEQIIAEICDNPSGRLATSINNKKINDYTYLIGTSINEIYPMSVEYGRGPVYPIRAKALAFYASTGELLFRKRVGPAQPRPFVAPAYDRTNHIAERIMDIAIGRELSKT